MARKASATLIGGFVVGAAVLAFASILLFGSGRFFKDTVTYVIYFGGSVKGLDEGSPVVFRGVKVGAVTSIVLLADVDELSFQIPVLIEIDRDQITSMKQRKETGQPLERDPREGMRLLVEKGMKAQLETRSFVTGMLQISLDFHPAQPTVFRDKIGKYQEIPSIPSSMAQLMNTLENLPITEMTTAMVNAMNSIEELLSSEDLHNALRRTDDALSEVQSLAKNADARTAQLAKRLDEVMTDLQSLLATANNTLEPLSADMSDATEALRDALAEGRRSMATIGTSFEEDSPTRAQLDAALKDFSAAARSLRGLTEYLERHPEALLKGKGGE